MVFTRVVLGWAAVTLSLVIWGAAERRLRQASDLSGHPVRAGLVVPAIEGLLLTLFAGLWFGSLGSGGAVLLFLLVGALMEIPHRLRGAPNGALWKATVIGILRIVLAGMVLRLVMG